MKTVRKIGAVMGVVCVLGVGEKPVLGEGLVLSQDCGTEVYVLDPGVDCTVQAVCDDAPERDSWTGDAGGATKLRLRMLVHIFDPEILELSPAQREARIAAQLADTAAHFDARNIELVYTYQTHPETDYEALSDYYEALDMKAEYAEDPDQKLNVYVSNLDALTGIQGFATFPWHDDAMDTYGGVVVAGANFDDGKTVLTHEIGHILGLWHTHKGHTWAELDITYGCSGNPILQDPCDCPCHEAIDDEYCDEHGDLCCDMPVTSSNLSCTDPSQNGCDGDFGATDYTNYVGYARDGETAPCRNHFTPQQARRMHCWACSAVPGWIDDRPARAASTLSAR